MGIKLIEPSLKNHEGYQLWNWQKSSKPIQENTEEAGCYFILEKGLILRVGG